MPQLDDAAGVRTVYDDEGHRPPVVILHGGLESARSWGDAAAALAGAHRVLRPDRRGHGRTPDVEGPYTYELMADETVAFLDQVVGGPSDLVGYSDGGVIALLVVRMRPDLVRSVVVIGTDFHHDGLLPAMTERLRHPDPENPHLQPMRDEHAALSPDGAGHWPVFHAKVSEMGATGPTLTPQDLSAIDRPVLVVVGDDDVVDHHHTIELYEALADGQLAIVPGASHLLPTEQPQQLLALVQRFIDGGPPQRMMPMRMA
jgi:pimeloyl-ACP methyl ester carboxylesterase